MEKIRNLNKALKEVQEQAKASDNVISISISLTEEKTTVLMLGRDWVELARKSNKPYMIKHEQGEYYQYFGTLNIDNIQYITYTDLRVLEDLIINGTDDSGSEG